MESGSPLDRAIVAAVRLSEEPGEATAVLDELRTGWYDALLEELGDPALAHVVQLIGDGMYYNAVTGIRDDTALADAHTVLARLRPGA
ncbi:hypothetical protein MF406_00325 [Georgenia sp. TF02-10]|nr:hypothetical protein MF406_00325 [Georgenia sp. TF02-10]